MDIKTKQDLLNYLNENKKAKFSIDRFEENFAVCENKETLEMINISKNLIPENASIGDILTLKDDILIIDVLKPKDQQKKIASLVSQLFKKKSCCSLVAEKKTSLKLLYAI